MEHHVAAAARLAGSSLLVAAMLCLPAGAEKKTGNAAPPAPRPAPAARPSAPAFRPPASPAQSRSPQPAGFSSPRPTNLYPGGASRAPPHVQASPGGAPRPALHEAPRAAGGPATPHYATGGTARPQAGLAAHPTQGAIVSRNGRNTETAHAPATSPAGHPAEADARRSQPRETPAGAHPGDDRHEAASHPAAGPGDHAHGPDASGHHPAAVRLTRTHDGKLALVAGAAGVGAGAILAHHADRGFVHADAHSGQPRDHASVDRDRAFVKAHAADYRFADVRRFDAHDLYRWRAGLWRNEWHYGRRGWWWETDGVWYPYAVPIYPYPLTVAALVAYDAAVVDGADLESAETGAPGPGAAVDIPPLPPAPPGWYRCGTPDGYFPSIDSCSEDWSLVQDAPPQAN